MNVLLSILGISCFFLVAMLFQRFLRPSGKVYAFSLIALVFLATEWASAQAHFVRIAFMIIEFAVVLLLAIYAVANKRKINRRYGRVLTYVLLGLVLCNLISCLATYGDMLIFAWSTYDSCKYFTVAYALMAMDFNRSDLKAMLVFLSILVLVCFAISFGQFVGIGALFHSFRGRYDIVIRSGSFRAIGFFPYPMRASGIGRLWCLP